MAGLTAAGRGAWRGPVHLVTSTELRLHAPEAMPERPARLDWAAAGAASGLGLDPAAGLPGYCEPEEPLSPEQLSLVHHPGYLEYLEGLSARGGGMIAVDTEVTSGSARAGKLAAAAAALGARQSVGDRRPALVLVRPPGHHAGPGTGQGFCLYNNVALAARLHQAEGGRRVAIVDWDVHHGNGTQEVFWTDPSVLFISLHESPLYPFTGWLHEVGQGEGRGTTVNLPLPGGLDDEGAIEALDRVVLPCLRQFGPDLILVSAGQDGHHADPMSTWRLTGAGFAAMAARLRELAVRLQAGLAAVLEGGYTPDSLGLGTAGLVAGISGCPWPPAVRDDAPRGGGGRPPRLQALIAQRLDEIVRLQQGYWALD